MRGSENFLMFLSFVIFVGAVISIGSTFEEMEKFSITGYATSSGVVNFTINSSASIDFVSSEIDWEAGAVESGSVWATLDSEGGVVNGTWTVVSEGFVVRNSGNLNLTLNLTFGKDASSFISGSGASYMYKVSNVEVGACVPPAGFDLDSYYEVGSSNLICDFFQPNKNINIDLKLVVPADSSEGALSDIVTIVYESV